MWEWFEANRRILFWLGLGNIVFLVGTLMLLPLLIARMPVDHFSREGPPPESWSGHHPVLRAILWLVKNVVGLTLLLAGAIMIFLPGQGVLTMVIGIGLIDFPGRHALMLRFVSVPAVWRALQWTRRKVGKPEFEPAAAPGEP